ncbi:unnamed protein product, partial [Ixodes hexagonus]
IIDLFEKVQIGSDTKHSWKPIRKGIVMSTTNMLHAKTLFLEELGFSFLLLSRFSTDALQILFLNLGSKILFQGHTNFVALSSMPLCHCFYDLAMMEVTPMLMASCLLGCPMVSRNMKWRILSCFLMTCSSRNCLLTLLAMSFVALSIVWSAEAVTLQLLTKMMLAYRYSLKVIKTRSCWLVRQQQ